MIFIDILDPHETHEKNQDNDLFSAGQPKKGLNNFSEFFFYAFSPFYTIATRFNK